MTQQSTKLRVSLTFFTYYAVDTRKSMVNCDPQGFHFAAKVIIVASLKCHWGQKSQFANDRGDVKDKFKYFPLWSFDELLEASPILGKTCSTITDDEIELRYCRVGGVRRHVFADSEDFNDTLGIQKVAIYQLTEHHNAKIAKTNGCCVGLVQCPA